MENVWLADIGGTWIRFGAVGPFTSPPSFVEPTPATLQDAVEVLSDGVRHARRLSSGAIRLFLCVGGLVSEDGRVNASIYTPFSGFNLREYFRDAHGLDVWVENDARFQLRGLPRSQKAVLLLTIGTGVGGAAGVDGRPLPSASGYAGEFGHAFSGFGNLECVCGRRGCIDIWLGGRWRAQRLGDKWFDRLDDDDVARDLFNSLGPFEAVLTSLLRVFDPRALFLTGHLFNLPPLQAAARRCADAHWSPTRLAFVSNSWTIGARASRRLSSLAPQERSVR